MNEVQFAAGIKPKSAQIDAVIIRANGERQELGTIAYYSRNPLKMIYWRAKQFLKGVRHGK